MGNGKEMLCDFLASIDQTLADFRFTTESADGSFTGTFKDLCGEITTISYTCGDEYLT